MPFIVRLQTTSDAPIEGHPIPVKFTGIEVLTVHEFPFADDGVMDSEGVALFIVNNSESRTLL